jgi:hypothetical protein
VRLKTYRPCSAERQEGRGLKLPGNPVGLLGLSVGVTKKINWFTEFLICFRLKYALFNKNWNFKCYCDFWLRVPRVDIIFGKGFRRNNKNILRS